MTLIHRLKHDIESRQRRQNEPESEQVEGIVQQSKPGQPEHGLRRKINGMTQFWKKINNDWIFNLSAMLAYNFLTSIFPILLFLIAVGGFVLSFASPDAQTNLQNAVAGIFPSAIGQTVVKGALHSLTTSAGLLLIIALVTALWSGSQLFVNISSAFNIIFRVRARDPIHQYEMSIGMMLLYTLLVPFVFLASTLSAAAVTLIFGQGTTGLVGFVVQGITLGVSLLVAVVLFGAIYVVVPNKPVHWREVWKGTLVAAALLVLYELLFPIYENYLLKPGNYGSLAGFAVVILAFFYYLGFILLLGAEVNSWELGQRETASDISGVIHAVQAYDTTRGAVGATAGMPLEDLQGRQGRTAMHDDSAAIHHKRVQEKRDGNQQPSRFAEATTAIPQTTDEAAEHTTGYNANRPRCQPSPGTNEAQEANSEATTEAGREQAGAQRSGRRTGNSRHRERYSEPRHASLTSDVLEDGCARQIGPTHPEYAAPLPSEARDLLHSGLRQPRKNGGVGVIAILATAALSVLMWFLGRNQRHA